MDAEKISRLTIAGAEEFSTARRKRKFLWLAILAASAAVLAGVLLYAGVLSPAVGVRIASAGWIYPSQVITDFNASGYVVAQRKAAVSSKLAAVSPG